MKTWITVFLSLFTLVAFLPAQALVAPGSPSPVLPATPPATPQFALARPGSPIGRPGDQSPTPPVFGAQLVLISTTIGDEPDLARLGLTVHAQLPGGPDASGLRYVASGSAEAAAQAAGTGLNVRVLDEDTAGKVYYWLDAEGAESAREAAGKAGTIVFEDERRLLLALPAAEEIGRLEELLAAGQRVSRLDPVPMVLRAARPAADPPTTPLAPAQADPTIAALLPLISAASLRGTMEDLSGVRPAVIGARTVMINTRYFWGARTADVEEYVYRSFANLGLPASYVPWAYTSNGVTYTGRNVIADIPGSLHPERIWLVGGHFDDQSGNSSYTYAPGADDNASGVAATLAIASVLAGHQFADTIRFVAFGAEEFGEWGSKRYAAALYASGAQVRGYLDLDMIGYDGNGDRVVEIHSGTGAGSIGLGNAFASANLRYGQGLSVELKSTTASNFSDHSSFWPYGYPAVLAIENFYDDGIPRDRNPYYHSTGDQLVLVNSTGDQLVLVNMDYVVRYTRASLATVAELAGIIAGPTATPTATPAGPTPTFTPAPTATATPMPPPQTCQELVRNGDFEGRGDWTLTATVNTAAYVTEVAHGGSSSVRVGLLPGQALNYVDGPERTLAGDPVLAGEAYSTVYQPISLPTGVDKVTLYFWYQPGTSDPGGDHQQVRLLRPGTFATVATLMSVLEGDGTWKPRAIDVTAFKGQTLELYFEVYNNDTSGPARTWMYLDDVSVQACTRINLPVVGYLPLLIR